MDAREMYKLWCEDPFFDQETKEELRKIEQDGKEIEERFHR